jgi:hypothetical protein
MKKGTKLTRIVIDSRTSVVAVYARVKSGPEFEIPLSHKQRKLFMQWKHPDFRDTIRKEFSNPDLFPETLIPVEIRIGDTISKKEL